MLESINKYLKVYSNIDLMKQLKKMDKKNKGIIHKEDFYSEMNVQGLKIKD
jgi:hypothetical protein